MADRRGRGDGSDDYDWLYGQQGAGRPAEDDDSTRVIPAHGRPAAQGPSGRSGRSREDAPPTHIAPAPGGRPGSPPPPSARRPARAGSSRARFRFRWLLWLVLAYVVFLVAVPVYAWTTVSKVDADPSGDRPEEQPGTTYLVVGSDARAGLSGRRTDTIMLLHTGDGPNLLMSIPRDSIVEIPGRGTNKINAAFAFGGPRLLTRTIENETGIRIDDYVEIGFRGFVDLVDAVGGIEICPETAMNDPLAELEIPKGCQEADGETALGYARSRKTQSLGDIDRARHQREVVSAIGSEVVSWKTVVNPFRYWNVVTAGAESVRVSEGTGPVAAAKFAVAMTRVDGESGLTCGVPIADLAVNWDRERADRLFKLIAEDRTADVGKDLCRPTGIAN